MKECFVRFFATVNDISSEALLSVIDAKAGEYSRIHLLISSPGGSGAHGLTLYNYLKSLPVEIFTYNLGSVDSIGVIIYCSGNRRFAVANSRFLIHTVSFNTQKNSFDEHQLNEHLKSVRIDQKNIAGVIAATTDKPVEEVEKLMHERTTLSSDEAVKYGLSDSIPEMPFIPADAEIISIPESAAHSHQVPSLDFWDPQLQHSNTPIQLPSGVIIRQNEGYSNVFEDGVSYTSSLLH